ncbi:MAG: hypothetical protein NC184_07610 [Roseburia sp.]|nr:hypothetical protein [Roseburia sp.]
MTTKTDEDLFKMNYCGNAENRKQMLIDFNVSVASFEELLVGHSINSYATGERKIENNFMILNVIDSINNKTYQPVFSETVARVMFRNTDIEIPRKMTVYSNSNHHADHYNGRATRQIPHESRRTSANAQLISLIELSRALMLFKVDNPKPMDGVFKKIYDDLNKYPGSDPFPYKIKSINTALGKYIESHGTTNGFHHLNDFIDYIQGTCKTKKINRFDFEILRAMFSAEYPSEKIYF